jgi:hypothetical protein
MTRLAIRATGDTTRRMYTTTGKRTIRTDVERDGILVGCVNVTRIPGGLQVATLDYRTRTAKVHTFKI